MCCELHSLQSAVTSIVLKLTAGNFVQSYNVNMYEMSKNNACSIGVIVKSVISCEMSENGAVSQPLQLYYFSHEVSHRLCVLLHNINFCLAPHYPNFNSCLALGLL